MRRLTEGRAATRSVLCDSAVMRSKPLVNLHLIKVQGVYTFPGDLAEAN